MTTLFKLPFNGKLVDKGHSVHQLRLIGPIVVEFNTNVDSRHNILSSVPFHLSGDTKPIPLYCYVFGCHSDGVFCFRKRYSCINSALFIGYLFVSVRKIQSFECFVSTSLEFFIKHKFSITLFYFRSVMKIFLFAFQLERIRPLYFSWYLCT